MRPGGGAWRRLVRVSSDIGKICVMGTGAWRRLLRVSSDIGKICVMGTGAWRWRLVMYPDNCTYLSVIGRICVRRKGAWRRLVMYPDNFTYLRFIGRISVRGEGAWRQRLQTRTPVQAHQWAANYFLVRMVVPGTRPVENPCTSPAFFPLLHNQIRSTLSVAGISIAIEIHSAFSWFPTHHAPDSTPILFDLSFALAVPQTRWKEAFVSRDTKAHTSV